MKRGARPELSSMGESILSHFEQYLRIEEDLSAATVRNYLSDLRQFTAWCEANWQQGHEHASSFLPEKVATPTLIEYRTYLSRLLAVARQLLSHGLCHQEVACDGFNLSLRTPKQTWALAAAFIELYWARARDS